MSVGVSYVCGVSYVDSGTSVNDGSVDVSPVHSELCVTIIVRGGTVTVVV